MSDAPRSPAAGLGLALAGFAAYACSDASVTMLQGHPAPYESVFFGALISCAALPFVRRPGERYSDVLPGRSWLPWLLRAASMMIGSVGSVTAFTYLSMAEAFCLFFLLPSFVTLLSVIFLRESVGWRRWSAVLLGFVGVVIVLRPGFRPLNPGHVAGVVTALAGGVNVVLMRAGGRDESRIALFGAGVIGAAVGTLPLMLSGFVWPSLFEWGCLLSYGLLGALGTVLLILAASRIPATLVAPTQYSQMLWGLLFGAVLFHNRLDWPMALGAAIIIGSGALTFLRERVRRPKGWQDGMLIEPPP